MIEEKFIFSSEAKTRIFTFLGIGIVLLALGIFVITRDGFGKHESHESTKVESVKKEGDKVVNNENNPSKEEATPSAKEGDEGGHGHGEAQGYPWALRLMKDLWQNNVFFSGIALIGIFFVAFNYVAQAGWSAAIKRIPEAFGNVRIPFGGSHSRTSPAHQ